MAKCVAFLFLLACVTVSHGAIKLDGLDFGDFADKFGDLNLKFPFAGGDKEDGKVHRGKDVSKGKTCESFPESECTDVTRLRVLHPHEVKCPKEGCDIETCCDATCSTFLVASTCQARLNLDDPLEVCDVLEPATVRCPKDGCTVDMCCMLTCLSLGQEGCDETADDFVLIGGANKVLCKTDAPLSQGGQCLFESCCAQTCTSYLRNPVEPDPCTGVPGLLPKDPSVTDSIVCGLDGCNDELCCDTTCTTFLQTNTCAERLSGENFRVDQVCPVEDPISVRCPDGGCDLDTCCMLTCNSLDGDGGRGACQEGFVVIDGGENVVCKLTAPIEDDGECETLGCCEQTCAQFLDGQSCGELYSTNGGDFSDVTRSKLNFESISCGLTGCDFAQCCDLTCASVPLEGANSCEAQLDDTFERYPGDGCCEVEGDGTGPPIELLICPNIISTGPRCPPSACPH